MIDDINNTLSKVLADYRQAFLDSLLKRTWFDEHMEQVIIDDTCRRYQGIWLYADREVRYCFAERKYAVIQREGR